MTSESEVKRLRDELVKLREQISRESSTVASKRKAAASARAQAARSKSSTTVQSKLREADRLEAAAVAAEKKRAGLEGKVATKEEALAGAQLKRDKEQSAAQKKAIDGLKKQADQAARQFNTPPLLAPRPRAAVGGDDEVTASDVFLSHASEDKDEIARPLADALIARGVTVWFDELNIRVGQSIRREIERGLRDARFGLVIISEHFMAKQWTQAELDALWGKKLASKEELLLPVWHKVTYDEVQQGLPLLAGLYALNTSTMSIDKIADLLAETIKG
jgi:hypothetical protein